MARSNRMALDMLLAAKGRLCHILLQPVAHLSQQHQYWFGQSSLRLDVNMFVKWKNFAQSSLYKRKNEAGNQDQSRVKSTEACSGNRQDTWICKQGAPSEQTLSSRHQNSLMWQSSGVIPAHSDARQVTSVQSLKPHTREMEASGVHSQFLERRLPV